MTETKRYLMHSILLNHSIAKIVLRPILFEVINYHRDNIAG